MWTTLRRILEQIRVAQAEKKPMGSPEDYPVEILGMHPENSLSAKSKDQYLNYFKTNSRTNQIGQYMIYFDTRTNQRSTGLEKGHGHPRGLPCKNTQGEPENFFSAKKINMWTILRPTLEQIETAQAVKKGPGQPRGLPCITPRDAPQNFFSS